VMLDAAYDHPTDKLYVDDNTHAHSAYAGQCTILRQRDAWPFQRGTSCNLRVCARGPTRPCSVAAVHGTSREKNGGGLPRCSLK
jgi:hypothetical protein